MRVRQTVNRGPPRLRQKTEESASTQRPRPPNLQPHPGSIPAQKPLSLSPCPPVASGKTRASSESGLAPAAFILNQNKAVCLPLVSENQKLVWVLSNHISLQLHGVAELDEAFDAFPYSTQREMAALARRCSLHPDQVKVWFMVQRLRYGISWDCEDICEVRKQHCSSSQAQGEEEQRHGMREEVREERREEKTREGELKKKERERAEEEKVRKEKRKEGGNSEEKVWGHEQSGREMKREEGMTEAGMKIAKKDRKAEAVEKEERNNQKKGEKLMVTDGMRKRKKKKREEDGVKEAGVEVRREREQATQTTPPVRKSQRVIRLPVRRRTQIHQSTSRQQVPHKQIRSLIATSGAPMLPKEVSPILPYPSRPHNTPDPKVSHPDRLQWAQSMLWNNFQCDEKLSQMELLQLRNETGFSTKSIPEWHSNRSHAVLNEKQDGCASPALILQLQNQACDAPPLPHNQVASVKRVNAILTSTSELSVMPPINGFEGKTELEPKQEPELHAESTNHNAVIADAGKLKGEKEAVIVENNPPVIDVPPRGPILTPWHEKPGTLTETALRGPTQHSFQEQCDSPMGALRRVPTQTRSYAKSKTRAHLELLRQSFLTCQFPKRGDYDRLVLQTGLPRHSLVQWFGDMRYYIKTGKPRWLNQEEHSLMLATIKHRQQMNALAISQASKGKRNLTWKVKLERGEMVTEGESAPLPPE